MRSNIRPLLLALSLGAALTVPAHAQQAAAAAKTQVAAAVAPAPAVKPVPRVAKSTIDAPVPGNYVIDRSEERRVGKECRL